MAVEITKTSNDELIKQRFRDEYCNIVVMDKSKRAKVPIGYEILQPLQSLDEFNKVVNSENWAITQTNDSNIIFVDLDHNNPDQKLNKFFNRRRDKYINHSELINSKHGFLKVVDADHDWCVKFAEKYHLKSGIEIYAEKHWGIFAGTYYNNKNEDDPKRETMWHSLDDLHKEPIIKVTKEDLGNVFGVIQLDESISAPSNLTLNEIIKDNFVVKKGQNRGIFVIKYMTSRIIKNPEFLDNEKLLLDIAQEYNEKHCDPPQSTEWLKPLIKQSIDYALKVLEKRQTENIIKSVTFDYNKEHKILLNDAIHSVNVLTKNKEKITKENLLRIMKSINKPDMKNYQEGEIKHEELLELLNLVSKHAQDTIDFLQSYLESKTSNRFAHINEVDVKDQFNCWYWNKKKWLDNSAHHVLESLLHLKGKEIKPNSRMALNICNNLSASDKTLKVSLDSPKYVEKMMSVVTNSHGQYFDFVDGKIKQVDPSLMFFKEPQLDIFFKDDIEKPENFLKFVKEKFPDEYDSKIFIDHLAGSLLHTSVLKSKPKMLFICGLHNSYKSLIIEIMKKVIINHSISKVSVQQLADKWGLSLIAEKILNYSEEENTVEPKDPANLKDAITIESGTVHVKFGKKLVYVSRFPRHIIMCNKIAPIAKDDDDESIFIRNQYLEIKKVEPPLMDWRIELLDDDEIQKIGMFLLKRASEIFNGSKINIQELEESKKKHRKLTLGTIEEFLNNHCITKGVSSDIGTSFNWILAKYNETMPSRISNKLLTQQLEDIGHEKKIRTWVYRYTNEPNVFNESELSGLTFDNKTQQTIVMGLKPSKIETTGTPRNDAKTEKNNGIVNSDNT